MTAALVVFAVFAGVALVVATVQGCVLVAEGRMTLPGTNMRRLQNARVALEVDKIRLERVRVEEMIDQQIDLRHARALK